MFEDVIYGKVFSVPKMLTFENGQVKPEGSHFHSGALEGIQCYGKWEGLFLCLFRSAIRVRAHDESNQERIFYLDRASSVRWIKANLLEAQYLPSSLPIDAIGALFKKIVEREKTPIFPCIAQDLEEQILGNLDEKSIEQLFQVSTSARNTILNSPTLEQKREKFIEDHAIGPKKWIKWGVDDLKEEDIKEANVTLPKNIEKILNTTDALEPTKKVKDTHVLVWVPKNLTINILGRLKKFDNIWGAITDQLGDKTAKKSGWVLMRKEILSETHHYNYNNHKRIVCEFAKKAKAPYKIPEARVFIACVLAHFLNTTTRERLFSRTYAICKGYVRPGQYGEGCSKFCVGKFDLCGLKVGRSWSGIYCGIAPVLWLS